MILYHDIRSMSTGDLSKFTMLCEERQVKILGYPHQSLETLTEEQRFDLVREHSVRILLCATAHTGNEALSILRSLEAAYEEHLAAQVTRKLASVH